MKLSTRYGAIGVIALGGLTVTHWMRGAGPASAGAARYLLGVLPNVFAAVAIPFVVMAIWEDHAPSPSDGAARIRFGLLSTGSCIGLVAWEFVQQTSRRLVFDPDDIWATLVGAICACAAFLAATPRRGSQGAKP